MRNTLSKKVLLSILFLSLAASSYAEDKEEIWQPTLPGPFVTWTAPLCEKGKLNIQPLYFCNITRGIFDSEGGYKSLPPKDYQYQQLIQLFMQYGILEHIEIDAQPSWQFTNVKMEDMSAESGGFGDLQLMTRWCPIEETKWTPKISALFQVKLPTGKYQKADEGKLDSDITGTGSTDYTYGLNFTKGIKPVLLHLDLLYTTIPSPVKIDDVKTKYSDIYNINLAAEWVFYKNFNLLGGLLWQWQGDTRLDGEKMPSTNQSFLIGSVGLGYSQESWQILIGYQRTLTGENVDANDTVAATIVMIF